MHNPFKRIMKVVDPIGYRVLGMNKSPSNSAANVAQGASNQANTDINNLESQYNNVPQEIRDSYTNAAKTAGTYANTDQFNQGLDSEVQAGARGARTELAGRIQALQRAQGMNEQSAGWFNPDQYNQTQGNNTALALSQNPVTGQQNTPGAAGVMGSATPGNTGASAAGDTGAQAMSQSAGTTGNSAAAIQSKPAARQAWGGRVGALQRASGGRKIL